MQRNEIETKLQFTNVQLLQSQLPRAACLVLLVVAVVAQFVRQIFASCWKMLRFHFAFPAHTHTHRDRHACSSFIFRHLRRGLINAFSCINNRLLSPTPLPFPVYPFPSSGTTLWGNLLPSLCPELSSIAEIEALFRLFYIQIVCAALTAIHR